MNKVAKLTELYEKFQNEFKDKEIVLGEGNPDATLLLIGEAPGREEVKLSKPFVGTAGKNLTEFLNIVGINREDIYITNAIKFRLSKVNPATEMIVNRPATQAEIVANRQYLLDEIQIILPEYIVTLGNVPLKAVTGENDMAVGQVHGRLQTINLQGKEYKLFPLYHPASIIYKRELKEVYIEDIKALKRITTGA